MIRHCCAWSLLLLAVSPFTAPFSTCDLATLLGHHHASGRIVRSEDGIPIVGAIESLSLSPLVQRPTVAKPFAVADCSARSVNSPAAAALRAAAVTAPYTQRWQRPSQDSIVPPIVLRL
jgi:hypothetical protein